jgi:hypothetical protein
MADFAGRNLAGQYNTAGPALSGAKDYRGGANDRHAAFIVKIRVYRKGGDGAGVGIKGPLGILGPLPPSFREEKISTRMTKEVIASSIQNTGVKQPPSEKYSLITEPYFIESRSPFRKTETMKARGNRSDPNIHQKRKLCPLLLAIEAGISPRARLTIAIIR